MKAKASEEIKLLYRDRLEFYKNRPGNLTEQERKEFMNLLLCMQMDSESLFQFGEGKRLLTLKTMPCWARFKPVLYQAYENADGEIILYWKDGMTVFRIWEEVNEISLSEFHSNPELHSMLNQKFPPEQRKLSEEQAQIIRRLYHEKLETDVREIYGYDGTGFYLRIEGEPPADYEGWSYMVKEWELFVELTAICADVSEPEEKRFYIAHVDNT